MKRTRLAEGPHPPLARGQAWANERATAPSPSAGIVASLLLLLGCGERSAAQVVGHAGAGPVWQIAAAGPRVYAADRSSLTIYDVADPRSPRELGRLESPGTFGAMAASGSILYVEVGIPFKGLEEAAGSLDQQWIRRGWLKIDERSYSQGVFVGVSNLIAFDLADPAQPRFLGALNITPPDSVPSRADRMILAGSTLYVSPGSRGALIVDVADPRQPKLLGALDRGLRVALAGRHLAVADGAGVIVYGGGKREEFPGGFAVVDGGDPGRLREVGRLDALRLGDGDYGANVDSVAVLGHHAYLGLSVLKGLKVFEYLAVVDFSDPARPRQVSRLRMKRGIADLGIVGRTLYAEAEGWILRFDLADPAKPKPVGKFRLGSVLSTVFGESGLFAGTWDGLHVLRFPAKP